MARRPQRDKSLDRMRHASPAILPSLLLCDFANLESEIRRLEDAGIQILHLDVMDGQFVPNFTYGMTIVEAVRRSTELLLDVHLMMHTPERYISAFAEAGADCLTIHAEAVLDAAPILRSIRDSGLVSGVAYNPSTPFDPGSELLAEADLVLVMSVDAGFGGQAFQPIALERIRLLKERFGTDRLIEVDGGIKQTTIGPCRKAGADLFVVGSAIFAETNYRQAIQELEAACHSDDLGVSD